jgi:glutathione synthase/RimK-type ligase-like ATP-grasp enzyme
MSETKRVLFISRRDERRDFDTAQSMAGAMAKTDSRLQYEAANCEDLVFSYNGTQLSIQDALTGNGLDEYDGIFMLGWFKSGVLEDVALSVAKYAEAKRIPLLNSEALYTRSRTKLSQYVIAALHNISITPFVYCMDQQHIVSYLPQTGIVYPLIAKSTIASRGRDNYLLHTQEALTTALTGQPNVPFVVQSFVPNDGDYRLIVMGDEVTVALHRQTQTDSHLNNTSQGGTATVHYVDTLDPTMLAQAVTMARLLRRQVTGVDMIIHRGTGQFYMLEANNMPQLSTGKHVDIKMTALNAFLDEVLAVDKTSQLVES